MFQNAGEKGKTHQDPDDPPRRRANKRRGRGTMANDRPPVVGIVGRQSGQIRLFVLDNTQRRTIQPKIVQMTPADCTINTDEYNIYSQLPDTGRTHCTVSPSIHEWARDDDGDGIREVHCCL